MSPYGLGIIIRGKVSELEASDTLRLEDPSSFGRSLFFWTIPLAERRVQEAGGT